MARKTAKKQQHAQDDMSVSEPHMSVLEPQVHPASNLMLADIVMRMGTRFLRRGVESTFLREKYGKQTADALVHERHIGRTIISVAIARIGTKSIPGAALVTSGLLLKALIDRSKARQAARRRHTLPGRASEQSAD